jgi:RNA polymerase sigma-70 factor, ECF subfamily
MQTNTYTETQAKSWTDEEVIDRVLSGQTALYELLVRRHNQKLYRAVRAVLRDDSEAEDTMQEAYVRAFKNLPRFERRSSFGTWVTRIAVNEAIARLKSQQRWTTESLEEYVEGGDAVGATSSNPESEMAGSEARGLLEEAILRLPLDYRTVVMMRDVEEMTTAETATALELTEEAVKVRLHRARAMMRRDLFARVGATSAAAFQFQAPRCDRVAAAVMKGISEFRFQIED